MADGSALIAVLAVVLVIALTTIYLITAQAEGVAAVAQSINPKSASAGEGKRRVITQFWVPDGAAYQANQQAFEAWLTEHSGWWSRTPMANTRTVGATKKVLSGFFYQVQDPVPSGLLANNSQQAVQNQALKYKLISSLDEMWTEIARYDVKE